MLLPILLPQPINTTPTIQRPQPKNVNNNDEIENMIKSAKKRDIYMDMQSYDRNQQYIDSMKDYVYDVQSMFLDNDDNQLY